MDQAERCQVILMQLDDNRKAILWLIWFKGDSWQDPADLAPVINLVVTDLILIANSLCAAGLLQSRKVNAEDGEWKFQYRLYRMYKLTGKGEEVVKELLDVVNGKMKEVKL